MQPPPLGEQELEILGYVAEHAPISVREVAERYGDERGLARTTILTVMERLRKKGYLSRVKQRGIYEYSAVIPQPLLLKGLVRTFVEKTLGGSLVPFVAYLAESKNLSAQEIAALRALMAEPESEEEPR
jgi:predicted transcriptional regulator